MSKPYKEIAPISPENREAIRRKTAYSLPDEPSARGMPPDQIRKHFWSALTGDRQSLFVEIDRVAKETNAAFDALLILLFGTVDVNGESVRLAELIPTGLAGDYTLADLLAGLADGSAQELISSGVDGLSMAEYLALLHEKAEEGGGGGGIAEETDPTVPAWAKQPSKPTYTATEVGARPNTWMPSAADVGARPATWTPSYSDVGAEKSGAASAAVSEHNVNIDAHNDIRLLVQGLADRLNAFANSTDEDLDQAQEFMLYIKANRDLISQITTSKVSVADIVNNLTTNVTNKPLSAAQGVALKALIDALDKSKLGTSELSEAIAAALEQAKESGEFDGAAGKDGADGTRGVGILKVTTAPSSYTTATGGKNPIKRMSISTIKTQAGVSEVLVGDNILYSYYLYHVYYLDATYAYMDTSQSIRGATGAAGTNGKDGTSVTVNSVSESAEDGGSNVVTFSDGKTLTVKNGGRGSKGDKGDTGADGKTPVKGTDYFTAADKSAFVADVKASLPKLTMVGTDADGVEHTWTIYGS